MQRYALALDLKDDDSLIAEYEKAHQKIWPEVRDHLRESGIQSMEIYRLGTRLFMVMEVDDWVFDLQAKEAAANANPAIVQWEQLMWRYQTPTPWTPSGQKWVAMTRIFDLKAQ